MAVKVADTIKAMSNTFPVAECIDIDVNINGATKRLQKAIDDGDIGGGESTWKGTHEEWEALSTEEKGKYEVICFTDDYDESGICGSDSTWKGTHEEWEALSPTDKGKYEVVYFTDDYDESGICRSDSTWKGTRDEWEALLTEEKGKYEVVYFTDDYDGSGICESDSIWKGTRDEWEALLTSEKQKYVIVCFTNDYDSSGDGTGLIDDINTSVKTTYSSSKIENSLSKKVNTTDLTVHTSDTNIHVTTSDKTKWNNSVNKTDIVDNLTSTNTDKPLSANQGKILKGEVGLKANSTDLTSHTSDTNIHITTAERTKWNKVDNKANVTDLTSHTSDTNTHITTNERTKWNEVDNKVNKTDIVDNLTSTDTNKPLSAKQGKALNDKIGLKANTTDLTTHTSNTDVHVTTAERTKWNKIDNKIDKASITTTINSTSTDTQVPSAKSVYDNAIKDKNIKTYTNVSQLGLKYPITVGEIFNAMPANSMAHLMADTSSEITDCPSTNGILIIDKCYMSKFSIEFKISASGETATNTLYIGQLKGTDGSGLTWQRVCTTKAADVNKTSITSNNTDLYTIGQAYYCVKNGICYINFWPITVKKTGCSIKTGKIFPHPLLVRSSGILVDGNGNFGGQAYIGENGELRFDCILANIGLYCTISYPVENS